MYKNGRRGCDRPVQVGREIWPKSEKEKKKGSNLKDHASDLHGDQLRLFKIKDVQSNTLKAKKKTSVSKITYQCL